MNVYDSDGNYYSVGITGDQYQLHYHSNNNTLTWNPTFNQYPDYFGMDFEEPLIIEANKTLYFEYCTNTSWNEPIRLEYENIDLNSLRAVYDYNYLLKPEHYEWYSDLFGYTHDYEHIAYSFKEDCEYQITQYYYESFEIYENTDMYEHTFDIGNLTLEDDFVNLSLFSVVGLTPTFESEILSESDDFSTSLDPSLNQITITDLNVNDGKLDVFDQITVILNYSYGPISSYSEVKLLDSFNQTFLTDPEESFYSHVDIDFSYRDESGEALFAEMIREHDSSFTPISYTRNTQLGSNNQLDTYTADVYDKFRAYYDESSIIYTADLDMDGSTDYKHLMDLNKDGTYDVIKYGKEQQNGDSEQIIWYNIIQQYYQEQTSVNSTLKPEQRTKWFDIDDTQFAHYEFNVVKLLGMLFNLPYLLHSLSRMILPDVDYWAQKSIQREVTTENYQRSTFYGIRQDLDLDGVIDLEVNYEQQKELKTYEVTEYKKTILAAKYQDIFTYLGDYIAKSVSSLFTGSREDAVFNEQLTEEHLESGNFLWSSIGAMINAPVLRATYRKFTENITSTYKNEMTQEGITIIEYDEEGEIAEQRSYTDMFDNNEIGSAQNFFTSIVADHTVTNVETEEELSVSFDPNIPFTHPHNISWNGLETWDTYDHVPVKYDQVQITTDGEIYTENCFDEQIYIRIPNRYSLYNDYGKTSRSQITDEGYATFLLDGMLITPQDGKVYYSSDIDKFAGGRAKTSGHYFYYDSDLNNYYETIYVLSDDYKTASDGTKIYDVISIGFNYDGIHDFAPYEKIKETKTVKTDFNALASERARFGSDWVYTFGNLKKNGLLFDTIKEDDIWDRFKPKDQLFEIYKLTEQSKNNPKFSTLFYEIRHETYDRAWDAYKDQLLGDIAEQVFMSTVAGTISAAIMSSSLGLATPLAHLAYFGVYTLLTKFYIDLDLHRADSQSRSQTFYPVGEDHDEPVSLNERTISDRLLGEGMIAALIGSPGGFYTTARGGTSTNQYTAEILVTPPNSARMCNVGRGFLDLLWENFWNMGASDPDSFTALDFDNQNIDYLLLTSELPSYNKREGYRFVPTDSLFHLYDMYALNTKGFVESEARRVSDNQFNALQPSCIDGNPTYNLVKRENGFDLMLPETGMYHPLILSPTRAAQLSMPKGHLVIDVARKNTLKTQGLKSSSMEEYEEELYEEKIPLNENGFHYEISEIWIDVIHKETHQRDQYVYTSTHPLSRQNTVEVSDYEIVDGNLYFTKPIETIITHSYPELESDVHRAISQSRGESSAYYQIHLTFDLVKQDSTDETTRLAAAQSTQFALMDYFNQYTYAQVTGNQISEIAYTETLTFWSTLISAPFLALGSYATKGAEAMIQQAGAITVKKVVSSIVQNVLYSPIKEVFQEIIEDSFIEMICENGADILGFTDDFGFLLSSLGTSAREVGGALGQIALGKVDFRTTLSLMKATLTNDVDTQRACVQKLQATLDQHQSQQSQKTEVKSSWKKILGSKVFMGSIMLMSSFFTFGLGSLSTLGALKTYFGGSAKFYSQIKADVHARRRQKRIAEIESHVGTGDKFSAKRMFTYNLDKQLKRPSDIDGADINALLRGEQTTNKADPPITIQFPDVSINPKTGVKHDLATTFNEIRLKNLAKELGIEKTDIVTKLVDDIRHNKGKVAAGKMLTQSMYPLIPPGYRISIDHNTPEGGFEIDDIIAYEKDGRVACHRIEYKYSQGGKVFYVMQGINKETNPTVDESPISEDYILGKVIDSSLEAVILMGYLAERGVIADYDILGIPEHGSIFRKVRFDPLDPNHKYPINENDSEASKLLKTIMNIIYKFESEIVQCHREIGNPLELNLVGGMFTRESQNAELIQLSKILGINHKTIYKNWLSIFEKSFTTKIAYGMRSTSLLIDMWQNLKSNLDYPQISDIYELFDTIFSQYALTRFNLNELAIVKFRLKFAEFGYPLSGSPGDSFTHNDLGEVLGKDSRYVTKFCYIGKYEEYSKFFDFLNRILFITPKHLNLYEGKDIIDLKKFCVDEIFNIMVQKGMISSTDFKEQFEIILGILHALTIALRRDPENEDLNILFKYTDLNREASTHEYRSLFRDQFQNDYESRKLKIPQIQRLISLLKSPKYYYRAEDEISHMINKLYDFSRSTYGEYHRFFKYHLLIPQTAELLKITLGLDVQGLNFIPDAVRSPISQEYNIDLDRAHLNVDKKYYHIFEIINNQDFIREFEELDFAFRLAPLKKSSHTTIDKSSNSEYRSLIVMARMLHLYSLLQMEYQEGKDYYSIFKKIFRDKTITLDGTKFQLWEGLSDGVIKGWVGRWTFAKTNENAEGDIFMYDNFLNEYYNNWYQGKYLPKMGDFKVYLEKGQARSPSFWYWFLKVYLRENKYPLFF